MFNDLPYTNEKNPVYRAWKVYSFFVVTTLIGLVEKVIEDLSDGAAIFMAIIIGSIIGITVNYFLPNGVGFAVILVFIALPFLWTILEMLRASQKHEHLNS